MEQIRISDMTLKQTDKDAVLSFKEKIEIPKLLDRLGVSVIEMEPIRRPKADALCIKSVASAVRSSVVAVPVQLNEQSVEETWNALKEARFPRLQVYAPVSSVQMEYLYKKKPDAMLEAVEKTIGACCRKTANVEFIAEDATRSDRPFLYRIVQAAIRAGAKTVTVCDATGESLPGELNSFLDALRDNVPQLRDIVLGLSCCNELAMADACAIAAIWHGVREIKAAAYPKNRISLPHLVRLLAVKGEACGVYCPVSTTELNRITRQVARIFEARHQEPALPPDAVPDADEDLLFGRHESRSALLQAVQRLGYELSEEDGAKVWEMFQSVVVRREKISLRELDSMVAAVAMQVPPTYVLRHYSITTGHMSSSMAHMVLDRGEECLEGIALGSGPVDAAFLAIEQILGCRHEVDSFRIQSVAEGRSAMGEAVIRLRSEGKLYSGRGTSTDIVGASINAYINALNKMAYEEAENS